MPPERKPCARCGGLKEAGAARRVCNACRAKDGKCERCGKPKPAGRGRRLCDECPRVDPYNGQRPCRACGGREGKQPNKQLCDECRELRVWQRRRRRKAMVRVPCMRCGKPKGPGQRRRLCNACRALKNLPRKCQGCGEHNVTKKHAKLCPACKYDARERIRERQRIKMRAQKSPPYKRGVKANERQRIAYRLRREREGKTIRPVDADTWAKQNGANRRASVPIEPLLPYIERWLNHDPKDIVIARQMSNGHETTLASLEALAELAGMSARRIYEIRHRKQKSVTLRTADQLCAALDVPFSLVYLDVEAAA